MQLITAYLRIMSALVSFLLISGCASHNSDDSKIQAAEHQVPQKPQTLAEWCLSSGQLLGNKWLEDWQKMALYEKMRNRGCMN